MEEDSGIDLQVLKVDGGAALLPRLAIGFWANREEITMGRRIDHGVTPKMEEEHKEKVYAGWKRTVNRSLKWEE